LHPGVIIIRTKLEECRFQGEVGRLIQKKHSTFHKLLQLSYYETSFGEKNNKEKIMNQRMR
jgi:hypothetical protein